MKLPLCLAFVLAAAPADADVIRLSCEGTTLSVDTAVPSVTLHFKSGFSMQYKNGSERSSYRFVDGSETPYTSDKTVVISEKEIIFSDHYQSGERQTLIKNVVTRATRVWRADQDGKVTEHHCVED